MFQAGAASRCPSPASTSPTLLRRGAGREAAGKSYLRAAAGARRDLKRGRVLGGPKPIPVDGQHTRQVFVLPTDARSPRRVAAAAATKRALRRSAPRRRGPPWLHVIYRVRHRASARHRRGRPQAATSKDGALEPSPAAASSQSIAQGQGQGHAIARHRSSPDGPRGLARPTSARARGGKSDIARRRRTSSRCARARRTLRRRAAGAIASEPMAGTVATRGRRAAQDAACTRPRSRGGPNVLARAPARARRDRRLPNAEFKRRRRWRSRGDAPADARGDAKCSRFSRQLKGQGLATTATSWPRASSGRAEPPQLEGRGGAPRSRPRLRQRCYRRGRLQQDDVGLHRARLTSTTASCCVLNAVEDARRMRSRSGAGDVPTTRRRRLHVFVEWETNFAVLSLVPTAKRHRPHQAMFEAATVRQRGHRAVRRRKPGDARAPAEGLVGPLSAKARETIRQTELQCLSVAASSPRTARAHRAPPPRLASSPASSRARHTSSRSAAHASIGIAPVMSIAPRARAVRAARAQRRRSARRARGTRGVEPSVRRAQRAATRGPRRTRMAGWPGRRSCGANDAAA